ncbi:carbohydrate kinase family protein [Bifidobacterium subtile]|uniref:2-keto-3-deoxygluconate kinase n=1 Tax=Bifidobacterium subtile TaxID=77635 RepID=A0A087E8E6_9BIFI|nr:hypothetical protein [Bifidobacterium subtile]KFJ04047.1 2-keto-3-deoxygluconate kinase [Bifidobacterium subtile]
MPANVIYDREWTTFRATGIDEYDWDSILDTKVVFLTGITASLTDITAQVVRYAADEAIKRGAEVILDVNFRRKLWSGGRAREVLEPIAAQTSVLFCSMSDARKVFGIEGTPEEVTDALMQRFGCKYVVSTNHRAVSARCRRIHRLYDYASARHRQAGRGRRVCRGDDSRIPVRRYRFGCPMGPARLRIRHHPQGRSDTHTGGRAAHPPGD